MITVAFERRDIGGTHVALDPIIDQRVWNMVEAPFRIEIARKLLATRQTHARGGQWLGGGQETGGRAVGPPPPRAPERRFLSPPTDLYRTLRANSIAQPCPNNPVPT